MGIKTPIEWCDSTVNPTENCDGCELWNTKPADPEKHVRKCYAGKMVERWRPGTFDGPIVMKPGRMAKTLKWRDLTGTERPEKPWLNGMPRMIFPGDMADMFSQAVKFQFLYDEVVDVVRRSPHIYILLTKQAKRMKEFAYWLVEKKGSIPHNLWWGVSVTSQATRPRLDELWKIKALFDGVTRRPRMLVSYGPALEPVSFSGYENCFDWMIIEGESGTGSTMLALQTVRNTLLWCRLHHVTPFVKQMGTAWARAHSINSFKGGDMNEWPKGIRVREMPR